MGIDKSLSDLNPSILLMDANIITERRRNTDRTSSSIPATPRILVLQEEVDLRGVF